ncbi:hypothetical protein BJ875DRAFT_532559 [Amylocarpus encephaloides]|uniref:non-specific serine/threonine protein kinase n=1 Tax=Amylocarpus encephaloides TaxID=45428 RepID=A0A9P8C8N7_9HELO|nr:hypothetical protein BJ875DRAFT_532559 [Amylocarpus encephaloides]
MVTASELDKIRCSPIKERLATFRHRFESTSSDLDVPSSFDEVQNVFSAAVTTVAKSLVLDLIQELQIEPAARILPSRIADRTLSGDLAILYSRVDSNQVDSASAIPLVERIVRNETDALTWNDADSWLAVFELVQRTIPVTPPIAFKKAVFDTPLRSSSASQSGSEQTHDEVDQRIVEELTGRVYYDVGGFYKRYFEGKPWTKNVRDIYEESRAQYIKGCWNGWPISSIQEPVFEWFMKYYTSANKVLRGSEAYRKLDIFLTPADAPLPDGEHDWSNDRSTKTLVQLTGYAREVFRSQPDRLMRLWVFDRSGIYSSKKFNIHEEPERFVKVITGYALMTDAELGLNTFIKRDSNSKYIVAQGVRISLEDKPIVSTKAIVCRGTTCYRGRGNDSMGWEYVVKLTWPSDKRQLEGKLLKSAKERGVAGIAEWFNDEQISIDGDPDTISHLRRDMQFGTPRKLTSQPPWVDNGAESSRASRARSLRGRSRSSLGHLIGLGNSTSDATISSTGQKRKRDKGFVDGRSGIKRFRSDGNQADVANVDTNVKEREPDTCGVEDDSLAGRESEAYGNRIHCCLVVRPAGRPLHAYKSVRELLEALRHAIAGHKSLLEDGKILHGDISENNIIITNHATEGDPKGRLIDLDLAKELDSVPSGGASHRTGTMRFMAIEVLQDKGHTYRHDLESFFLVLIWMCIRYGYEDPSARDEHWKVRPAVNVLRGLYTGTYAQIARNKIGDMDKNGFERIVAEFAPNFEILKHLARELRNVLFPIRDGAIFTGTFSDNSIMYDGMSKAFNRGRGSC